MHLVHIRNLLLCCQMPGVGLVHGGLSEYNVLIDDYDPVIIELPQLVDAAANYQD